MRVRDHRPWLAQTLVFVGAITLLRLVLLAFDRTDLFVDETQYWLWGQEFAFGYYSKPPLIGWLIGAVTALFGDDPFWVRAPGAVLHGTTALILAALGARVLGGRRAFWVGVSYATLPFVAVGSLLISTDTVMAPFFAAALYFHRRLVEGGGARVALACGAAIGVAFLAKYAAIYFLGGVALAALFHPAQRFPLRYAALLVAAFGVVIAPNIAWNLSHDLTTVSHTMDNVGWLRADDPMARLSVGRALEFLASQFAVFGPLVGVALIGGLVRRGAARPLWPFVLPALIVVTGQAMLEKAYANWAVSAFFAGTIIAVGFLVTRPRLMALSIAINGVICVALPVLAVFPQTTFGRDAPLLQRYLGRADLSRQIIAAAQQAGNVPVVARNRQVLADLFYTGRATAISVYSTPSLGRPLNHYAQRYALPDDLGGKVLLVDAAPPRCDGQIVMPTANFDVTDGAYDGDGLAGYLIEASCVVPE